jgi:transcriptional regulator with GAF, ATPase, and Fis domain
MGNNAPPELASDEASVGVLQLTERLGRGATAEVWRGRDEQGRDIALKVAHEPGGATALASEALVAGLALSPRLPELYAADTVRINGERAYVDANGRPAIMLRFAPGETLASCAPPETEALAAMADVAAALDELHDAGFAHGDVKPSNIVIADGRATLIDLGLAGPAGAHALRGATPRYLGRGDADLGDARARDILALGIVLAELCSSKVAASDNPLAAARALIAQASRPVARILAACLATAPGSRPSAGWLARAVGRGDARRASARVRATYLRLRQHEIGRAGAVTEGVAPWLVTACQTAQRLRRMCNDAGEPPPSALARAGTLRLGPMSLEQRRQWLVSLCGAAAIDWPLTHVEPPSEPDLAQALASLAEQRDPRQWSLGDLEAAIHDGTAPPIRSESVEKIDVEASAAIALALARRPVDRAAVELVERRIDECPPSLRLAAADALRLGGELGRARSLVLGQPGGSAIAADVLRRAGESDEAERVARLAMADGSDHAGRARAVLARLLLDRGKIAEATTLVGPRPRHANVAEVGALVMAARGDTERAVELAERGLALADTPESRARCAGALAYVLAHRDPEGSRRGYRQAVAHAVEAGALLEEASYRTGEAAACVDLGALSDAIDTSKRAALLWDEVLRRPTMAARAWLATAAAYAAVDAALEATQAAERAIAQASLGEDRRAEVHACWSIADAHPSGAPEAIIAAKRADELADDGYDADHSAARLWRHVPEAVTPERRDALDARCRHATASVDVFVRLSWWAARAERLTLEPNAASDVDHVLAELAALADAVAPVVTRGRAMHAGCQLALAHGDSDMLARLDAARRRDAAQVHAGATSAAIVEAARRCPWLTRASEGPGVGRRERALDLQQLVRALSERDELQTLLDRVVDVLLMWTGAERGLLLMPDADGALVPRSARNLGRRDLEGEQLAVSSSLAQRAMDDGEPVVAVDAMAELSSSYDSVHALKLRSVLAVPLAAHGQQLGCVYLDDRLRRGAFGEEQVTWARSVAPIAALAISDARRQAALREAIAQADAASAKLAETLAYKEVALDVAERELAQQRPTQRRGIIGSGEGMRRVLHLVGRVAKSDVPVLLRGESGSGKELVARAIHATSARADEPFVGENCGALPETLLESTLFGHVKGAFTGAHRTRIGLFAAANGGTLFLDEIGEMSLGMQTKLLRVLEDSMIRPVGATRAERVDVRILAATHRDLEAMVTEGTFREDLYYRLNVITIPIPPLRERRDDIPELVRHLVNKHAPAEAIRVTPTAMAQLSQHPWPGNVRQLENEVRRALLMTEGTIDSEHLSLPEPRPETVGTADAGLDIRTRIDLLEKQLVGQALAKTNNNQTQAAKLLGLSRYGLHKMMKRLALKD